MVLRAIIFCFILVLCVVDLHSGTDVDIKSNNDKVLNVLIDNKNPRIPQVMPLMIITQSLQQEGREKPNILESSVSINQNDANVNDRKEFPNNIVYAVRRHRFTFAEQLLIGSNFEKNAKKLCRETDFDSIMGFIKEITKITPSFYLLKALYEEGRKQDEFDSYQLMTLAMSLQKDVLNQKNVSPLILKNGKMLLQEIVEVIKTKVSDFLVNAMIVNKYQKNAIRENLCREFFIFKPDINDEVMHIVVNFIFEVLPIATINSDINSHEIVSQRVIGLIALFHKIREKEKQNNDAILDVVISLSSALEKNKSDELNDDQLEAVEKTKKLFPNCIKNLFFSDRVCLWSKAAEEYMFAANETCNYDSNRRRVFTWCPGALVLGSYWKIDKIGRSVSFKNIDRKMEYLYAADIEYNSKLRNVFTWIPGDNTGTKIAWNIEFSGSLCYFKNVHFQEYLYSSLLLGPDEMRHVFTWKDTPISRNVQFAWEVKSC